MSEKKVSDLLYQKKTVYEKAGEKIVAEAYEYARGYVRYLDASKTEREAVNESVKLAEAAGYRPYTFGTPMKAGDKFYYNNRGKNIYLFRIGPEDINNGIRITAAHIDSPRLDLKQVPVYEDNGMCYFKTHYYGGIRKYQWLATPLALHGVVVKQSGEVVEIVIGENDTDPVMYITDLLPHLAAADNEKPVSKAFVGEKLNILVGSKPLNCEDKDAVKLGVLQYLNETYGITEEDFLSAELSIVPAAKARDVGFDRALIGSYGHDDRVCAYPALTAILEADGNNTCMCILADKEETGSDGPTGMQCDLMLDLINELASQLGGNPAVVRANSQCLSADVSAAFDPNFADVFEKQNTPLLSCGAVFTKFTGSRGKSGTNDASAETGARIRRMLNARGVMWQTSELGKVDQGGGGTVAMFISRMNIKTVDLGVAVISMHAPYEVISKADLYTMKEAILAFYEER